MLEETDRLFSCGFCRVRSYLLQVDHFRYLLPGKAPTGRELFLFPYWRFKGMLFSSAPSGMQQRFIDISHPAAAGDPFPVSLGLRSQALKLRFVQPDHEGFFLKPTTPPSQVLHALTTRFNPSLPKPILHQAYVGETLSLIWSPFYLDGARRLCDAVLNQPISETLPDAFSPSLYPGGAADARLRFVATLCPACGWDLEGSRESLVLNCRNCNTCWHPTADGLSRLNFGHLPGADPGQKILFMPFWRIKASVTGLDLENYADLVHLANLPKAVQSGWKAIPFHFWVMAFKVQPQVFVRLARVMTLSQPFEELLETLPRESLHPVTLAAGQAFEALKILLASFLTPREDLAALLPQVEVSPLSCLLAYIPFEIRPHEYVQPRYHLAINRNMVALAGNL